MNSVAGEKVSSIWDTDEDHGRVDTTGTSPEWVLELDGMSTTSAGT